MYETVSLIVPAVLTLTQYLKKLLGWEGIKAQILSWIIGMLLGLAVEQKWEGLGLGLLAALVANGVFSMEFVKRLLDALVSKTLPVVLLLGLFTSAQAQSFSFEAGYQLVPARGTYFLLRYNYPVAILNAGPIIWLLPELGLLPNAPYLRTQLLIESKKWTVGIDSRLNLYENAPKETILRVFIRSEF